MCANRFERQYLIVDCRLDLEELCKEKERGAKEIDRGYIGSVVIHSWPRMMHHLQSEGHYESRYELIQRSCIFAGVARPFYS